MTPEREKEILDLLADILNYLEDNREQLCYNYALETMQGKLRSLKYGIEKDSRGNK